MLGDTGAIELVWRQGLCLSVSSVNQGDQSVTCTRVNIRSHCLVCVHIYKSDMSCVYIIYSVYHTYKRSKQDIKEKFSVMKPSLIDIPTNMQKDHFNWREYQKDMLKFWGVKGHVVANSCRNSSRDWLKPNEIQLKIGQGKEGAKFDLIMG